MSETSPNMNSPKLIERVGAATIHSIFLTGLILLVRPEVYGVGGFSIAITVKVLVVVLFVILFLLHPLFGLLSRINLIGVTGMGALTGAIVSVVFLGLHQMLGLFSAATISIEIAWIFLFSVAASFFSWLMLQLT